MLQKMENGGLTLPGSAAAPKCRQMGSYAMWAPAT